MSISEDKIREITLTAIKELGDNATQQNVKEVVERTIQNLGDTVPAAAESTGGQVILTSFGLNKPGVIAAITSALSQANCDISDLSQKLMGDFFTMIMIVDTSKSALSLNDIQNEMKKISDEMNIKIMLQHEEIFRAMHRI
ncbi:ACT domain protein [hydrothermal vent metagenome]|uniref:ACT domain protein n=1 Tax=hydrothermal vent metagenome TaxID=652676 RepID=A0A3B1BP14_9ZZZZ